MGGKSKFCCDVNEQLLDALSKLEHTFKYCWIAIENPKLTTGQVTTCSVYFKNEKPYYNFKGYGNNIAHKPILYGPYKEKEDLEKAIAEGKPFNKNYDEIFQP